MRPAAKARLSGLIMIAALGVPQIAAAQEPLPPAAARLTEEPQWVGVSSCAATACHGGRPGSRGGEYTTWITRDAHAKAYSVLFDQRSLVMARNLAGPGRPVKVPPHEDAACLSCHAPAGTPHSAAAYLPDGVGCESCHGAAGGWLAEHSKFDWQPLSVSRQRQMRAQLGMTDTTDLLTRAARCVECHVGGKGRDVNHDLIAAGHPRLNFEFNALENTMPAHWDRGAQRRADPTRVARGWMVGQATAAAAALDLLSQRAADEHAWPEFAEYDCFSCHHELTSPSWRQRRGYTGKPGALSWGDWYFSLPRTIATLAAREEFDGLIPRPPEMLHPAAGFDALRAEMAGMRFQRPRISAAAAEAAAELKQWAVLLNDRRLYTPQTTERLLEAVAEDPLSLAGTSWDASTQLYLALVALHGTWQVQRGDSERGDDDQRVLGALRKLRRDLRFSDASGDGTYRLESPRDFDPARFDEHLAELREALSGR